MTRQSLSAGAQLSVRFITGYGLFNQKFNEVFKLQAGSIAHLREHTDWCKARQSVDFIQINGRGDTPGVDYTATFTAKDSYGASTSASFTYRLLENNDPKKVATFDNILSYATGETYSFQVSDYFVDPDDDELTFQFKQSNPGVAHLSVADGIINLKTLAYGISDITITALDPLGKSVAQSLSLAVRASQAHAEAYPNPVVNDLYVSTGVEELPTYVRLISSTGAVLYEATTTFSAFNPLKIDMSKCAPGRYTLEVKYDGKTTTRTIIKK